MGWNDRKFTVTYWRVYDVELVGEGPRKFTKPAPGRRRNEAD
jgi:hypothetical protein